MKLSLLLHQWKGNECVCVGEIRGTFDQYFKCLQCGGVAETFTILRSCFNEAAVETLLITRLNCQRFTLKRQPAQEAQRRDERRSLLLCFFWRLSSCRVSLLPFEAYTYVWRRLALHPLRLCSGGCGGGGGCGKFSGLEIRLKAPCVMLKGAPVARSII